MISLIPNSFLEGYVRFFHALLLIVLQILTLKLTNDLSQKSQNVLAVLLSTNTLTLMIAVYVWSELLFTVLLYASLYHLFQFIKTKKTSLLIIFGLFLFGTLLTRNAGVFLVPGFLIIGFLSINAQNRWKYLISIAAACLGNGIWNLYVIFVMDHPEITKELIPQWSFWRNISLTFSELGYNFIPRQVPILLASISGLAITVIAFWKQTKRNVILALLITSYLIPWIFIPADVDNMGRFLAPILPLLLILISSRVSRLKNSILSILIYSCLVVFFIVRVVINASTWTMN